MKKFIITILIILFSCNYTFAKEIRYSLVGDFIYLNNGKYYVLVDNTMYCPDNKYIEKIGYRLYLPNGEELSINEYYIFLSDEKYIHKVDNTVYLPNGEYYKAVGNSSIYYSNNKPENLYYRDLAFIYLLIKKI